MYLNGETGIIYDVIHFGAINNNLLMIVSKKTQQPPHYYLSILAQVYDAILYSTIKGCILNIWQLFN
jgi:hypothetical protein